MTQILWSSESEGYDPRCPACGDPIDYCQGHGVMGDLEGHIIVLLHDEDEHARCNPRGCDVLREAYEGRHVTS